MKLLLKELWPQEKMGTVEVERAMHAAFGCSAFTVHVLAAELHLQPRGTRQGGFHTRNPVSWPPERVERLKELWSQRPALPARQVQKVLNEEFPNNPTLTRNAVLGAVRRNDVKRMYRPKPINIQPRKRTKSPVPAGLIEEQVLAFQKEQV